MTNQPENTNPLEGMQCPDCQSAGPFRVKASQYCLLHSNGKKSDFESGRVHLDDDDECQCDKCGFAGEIWDFRNSYRNTDTLEGLRCPKCKNLGPFDIQVQILVRVYDNGLYDDLAGAGVDGEGYGWEDSYYCACPVCAFKGKVRDFQITEQEKKE